MKKYLSYLMCFAMLASVACDDKPIGEEGPDTGKPAEGTKLVEKVSTTFQEDVYNSSYDILFTYDSQNRVIKVEYKDDDIEDGEYQYFTISYGTGKVILTMKDAWWSGGDNEPDIREEDPYARAARKRFLNLPRSAENAVITRVDGDRVLRETTGTYTYTLNSDGYLAAGVGESKESEENAGEFYSSNDAFTFTYNNGYISKGAYVGEWVDGDDSGIDTYTSSYTWSGGNLTKVVEKYEDDEYASEDQYDITYGTKINPTDVNIDMNSFVFPTEVGDGILSVFGFCGKSSKNLISSYSTEWGERNCTWETDSNGYVTKVSKEGEGEYYSAKSIYTVTYKK